MKDWLKKNWNDPVFSKVISNMLWTLLTAAGSMLAILVYKLVSKTSFLDIFKSIELFLKQERRISNWVLITALLFIFYILLNVLKTVQVKTFLGNFLFAATGGRDHDHIRKFIFDNKHSKGNRYFKNIYGFFGESMTITPSPTSANWCLKVVIPRYMEFTAEMRRSHAGW